MSFPAIFLDRDGTIIQDFGYNYRPEDQLVILPGATEALGALKGAGYKLVVITNQSGIGRGKFTQDHYAAFDAAMREQLAASGVTLDGSYHCPHAPEEACDCRKPGIGMLKAAIADLDLDPTVSIFVGDKDEDVMAGKAVGARTVRIATGQYPETVPADYTVGSLAEVPAAII